MKIKRQKNRKKKETKSKGKYPQPFAARTMDYTFGRGPRTNHNWVNVTENNQPSLFPVHEEKICRPHTVCL